MKFVAIDFETATPTRDSACAVGAVFGELKGTQDWYTEEETFYELIQPPENDYNYFNVSIHGITPEMTEDADPFDVVWRKLEERLDGHVIVAHNTAFDVSVLRTSAEACGFVPKPFEFLCTYRLARAMWENLPSWSLDYLADFTGLPLENHHHALNDANACAHLLAKLCEEISGASGWATPLDVMEKYDFKIGRFEGDSYSPFSNAKMTNLPGGGDHIRFRDLVPSGDVDETHPVYGLSFAFTGTLASMTRREAAQRVVDCGGVAHSAPQSKTDFLVVGMTDFTRVKDGASGKMKKAIEMAEAGQGIEIIDEATFLQMFV